MIAAMPDVVLDVIVGGEVASSKAKTPEPMSKSQHDEEEEGKKGREEKQDTAAMTSTTTSTAPKVASSASPGGEVTTEEKSMQTDIDVNDLMQMTARALKGDVEAMFAVGNRWKNGVGGQRNLSEARKWYLSAASKGHALAQYTVGLTYATGYNFDTIFDPIFNNERHADNNYSTPDQGTGRDFGKKGEKRGGNEMDDDAIALKWFLKAANQGIAEAQFKAAALMFHKGKLDNINNTSPNTIEINYLLINAAEKGHAVAQACWGRYCEVEFPKHDQGRAFDFYLKAAKKGHKVAQYKIGFFYETGHNAELDESKAVEWYLKSAEQGHMEAQYKIGVFYQTGYGVGLDESKAVEWYRKSAEKGFKKAQNCLAKCYDDGRGVLRDVTKAKVWYRKAAAQNSEEAKSRLQELMASEP